MDNADASGAIVLLSAAKTLPGCEASIGIVLAVSPNSIGLAEDARSHMVLYRPLSADRLRNGIKSALGLRNEGEEARESERASINIPANVRGLGVDESLAFITNLSASGAALLVGRTVPSASIQTIEFSLPDTQDKLSTLCRINMARRAGPSGSSLCQHVPDVHQSMQQWLTAQTAKRVSKANA